jgi:hypothetical protein
LPAERLNTHNHPLIFSRAQAAENGNKRRALGSGLPKMTENDKLKEQITNSNETTNANIQWPKQFKGSPFPVQG